MCRAPLRACPVDARSIPRRRPCTLGRSSVGPHGGVSAGTSLGVTRMHGDAGTAPVGSWNDLLAGTAECAGRDAARHRRRSRAGSADPARSSAPTATGWRIATVGVAAGAITLLVSVAPFLHFAYRSAATHVFIDTAATVIALLVAVLLAQRYRRSAQLRDLLLVAALGVLAAANLLLSVVPALVAGGPHALSTWGLLGSRLLGAALLACPCVAPRTRIRAPGWAAAVALLACTGAVAAIAGSAVAFSARLPAAVDAT